jgi:hypothetical protein
LSVLDVFCGGINSDFLQKKRLDVLVTNSEQLSPHLAAFVHESELEGVPWASSDRRDFSGYPALFLVWEPDAGSFAVDVFGHFNLPGAVDYLNFDSDAIASIANPPLTLKMLYFRGECRTLGMDSLWRWSGAT